jgi:hypothetical protein
MSRRIAGKEVSERAFDGYRKQERRDLENLELSPKLAGGDLSY